jgi:hypothetical protein
MVDTPRKTFPELQALTAPVVDSDVLAVYRSPGPAKRTTASVFGTYVNTVIGTPFTRTLLDDADAATARATLAAVGTAELAASTGAGLVGFLQAGTGATARTVQARLRDQINIKDFGAVLDNSTDCAAAINAAATAARAAGKALYAPPGTGAYIASAIDLTGLLGVDFSACPIRVNASIVGVPVECGGFSFTGQVCDFRFAEVTDGTSEFGTPPARPIIQFVGVKNSEITLGTTNHVRFYADSARGSAWDACAYNHVTLTGVQGLVTLTDAGGAASYVNENFISAARILRLTITGVGYGHNHNLFYGGTFEGSQLAINLTNCSTNRIYNARFEGVSASPGITFAANAFSNTIQGSWNGSSSTTDDFKLNVPVSDSGAGNMVTTESATLFRKTNIFNVSAASRILASATETTASDPHIAATAFGFLSGRAVLVPGLNGVRFAANEAIVSSDPIPVNLGDVILFAGDFDGSVVRPLLQVLDANKNPLGAEGVGGPYISMNSQSYNSGTGTYTTSADVSKTSLGPASIIRTDVKFVRVGFWSGAGGWARSLSASMFTQALGRDTAEGAAIVREAPMSLAGLPTRGFAPLYTLCFDRTAKLTGWVNFVYETTINGALSAGATTATVTAIGFAGNGDVYNIVLDDGDTITGVVAGTSGNSFTIAAVPSGRTVPNGSRVAFCRWTS